MVSTSVTVTRKRACAPAPVAVDTKIEVLPSESVAVAVITVSPLETLVETESDVVRDSTNVGMVVVTTTGDVAIGIEFCCARTWARKTRDEIRRERLHTIAIVRLFLSNRE